MTMAAVAIRMFTSVKKAHDEGLDVHQRRFPQKKQAEVHARRILESSGRPVAIVRMSYPGNGGTYASYDVYWTPVKTLDLRIREPVEDITWRRLKTITKKRVAEVFDRYESRIAIEAKRIGVKAKAEAAANPAPRKPPSAVVLLRPDLALLREMKSVYYGDIARAPERRDFTRDNRQAIYDLEEQGYWLQTSPVLGRPTVRGLAALYGEHDVRIHNLKSKLWTVLDGAIRSEGSGDARVTLESVTEKEIVLGSDRRSQSLLQLTYSVAEPFGGTYAPSPKVLAGYDGRLSRWFKEDTTKLAKLLKAATGRMRKHIKAELEAAPGLRPWNLRVKHNVKGDRYGFTVEVELPDPRTERMT